MSKNRWDAMMVEEYVDGQGQGRSKWTKIGAAFENKDGSIGIQVNAFPINGKMILQVPLSKEEREAKFGKKESGGGGGRPQGGQQRRGNTQPQQGGFGNYGGRRPPAQPAQHPNAQGGDGFADDDGPPAGDEIPF